MKIACASDLHVEFYSHYPEDILTFPQEADVIILAGDIDVGSRAVDTVQRIAEEHPNAAVVWVAGNHEFYRANMDDQIAEYRTRCAEHERIHYLENDCVEIGGYSFLGCTLWSDFTLLGEQSQHRACDIARRAINDFRLIEVGEARRFTPEEAIRRFTESRQFLSEAMAERDPSKTIVVTHFPPGMETRNTNFPTDLLTAYFQANVSELILQGRPALWVYGHNHFGNDLRIGNTHLVSNQLGYPQEGGRIPPFDAKKVIELQ